MQERNIPRARKRPRNSGKECFLKNLFHLLKIMEIIKTYSDRQHGDSPGREGAVHQERVHPGHVCRHRGIAGQQVSLYSL